MSMIEKAVRSLNATASKNATANKTVSKTANNTASNTASNTANSTANSSGDNGLSGNRSFVGNDNRSTSAFDLQFDRLAAQGFYYPGARTSQLAQELRAVKRRLLRRVGYHRAAGGRSSGRSRGRRRNLVLVTSARAGEGKTYSATNLALSLAIEDQIDTLLVDADLQRPKVRKHLDMPACAGLADALLEATPEKAALSRQARQAPLSVLTEGAPVARATELFAGDVSKAIWSDLSAAWRDGLVIIDAPPVLAASEAVVLARFVDEIIFVVEANATPEPAVAAAVDEILDINPNVSLMLNRCLIGAGGSHYGSYECYDRREEAAGGAAVNRQAKGGLHVAN